jgi:hypothetical protein
MDANTPSRPHGPVHATEQRGQTLRRSTLHSALLTAVCQIARDHGYQVARWLAPLTWQSSAAAESTASTLPLRRRANASGSASLASTSPGIWAKSSGDRHARAYWYLKRQIPTVWTSTMWSCMRLVSPCSPPAQDAVRCVQHTVANF